MTSGIDSVAVFVGQTRAGVNYTFEPRGGALKPIVRVAEDLVAGRGTSEAYLKIGSDRLDILWLERDIERASQVGTAEQRCVAGNLVGVEATQAIQHAATAITRV